MLDLAPPFEDAAAIFPTWEHEGKEQLQLKPMPGKSAFPLVLSAVPCTDHVEMEAVLQHPTWNVTGPLGLVLNANAQDDHEIGYMFVVEVQEPATLTTDNTGQLTLAQAVEKNLPATLSIFRGTSHAKYLLVQKQIPIGSLFAGSERSLRLRALSQRLRVVLSVRGRQGRF